MNESPVFKKMKEEDKLSKSPLMESFGEWQNLKIVLLGLFGLVAGQAAIWYTGQFYALFFLTSVLKVDGATASILMAIALILATPFFVIFGKLSDSFGRRPIILLGLLLPCLSYFSLFGALTQAANPDLARAQIMSQIVVKADPSTCTFQGSPIAREIDFTSACDIAKSALTQKSASYTTEAVPMGTPTTIKIGDKELVPPNATLKVGEPKFDEASMQAITAFRGQLGESLIAAGYPTTADPAKMNKVKIVFILFILVVFVTMVYGPIAATLVELFPTRIRYSSMSLAYHIGNGWFGGLMPTIAFSMVAQNGDIYYGLWYPIVIAAVTFTIGLLFLRETKDVDIYAKFLYWHPKKF
jgi:MFS family permease